MQHISVLNSNHEFHDTLQYTLLSVPGPAGIDYASLLVA